MTRFNTATIENATHSMLAKCKQLLMAERGKKALLKFEHDLFSHLNFHHSTYSDKFLFPQLIGTAHLFYPLKHTSVLGCRAVFQRLTL